jgi:guanylate kinase
MTQLDPYHRPVQPLLVVISGPSGVGKDALIRRLRERQQRFHFVVTATDRPPRAGEVHDLDYHFVTTDEFRRMIVDDELLEHAVVYGQYKGIPKPQVRRALASGRDVVMRLDVQGARTIRCLVPESVMVFLVASSEEELAERLRRRKGDTVQQIEQRLAIAKQELGRIGEFDYVVANREGELDQAVDAVLAIIEAEHCRVKQRVVAP